MALTKLYKMVLKGVPEDNEAYTRIYKENGVIVVGNWQNIDNPQEFYFITTYRDQEHYDEFTSLIKNNPSYIEAANKINAI